MTIRAKDLRTDSSAAKVITSEPEFWDLNGRKAEPVPAGRLSSDLHTHAKAYA